MFVYQITNKINEKKYVGQHTGDNLQKYWNRTVGFAISGRQERRPLYRAIRKYGPENFDVRRVVVVGTKQELDLYECGLIRILDLTNPEKGYNLTIGGEGTVGFKPRKESRRLVSESLKGRKQSEESKRKRSVALKGRTFSEESRLKMSESAKKRQASRKTREINSKAQTGKKHSKKTKNKMRDARYAYWRNRRERENVI